MTFYIDTSALAKLVIVEPESDALRAWMTAQESFATGNLTRAELMISTRRNSPSNVHKVQPILESLEVIAVTDEMYLEAGISHAPEVRALDAVHVTVAFSVTDLEGVVTYDHRMAGAAEAKGIPAIAPG